MRRRTWAIVLGLLLTGLLAPSASACSCAPGDPRDSLESSDGAFIGRLVSRDEPSPGPNGAISSNDTTTYHFIVDEEIKGEFGDRVAVRAPRGGASCGLEAPPGRSVGLFLSRKADGWHSSLCAQIDPNELRRAAKPLPSPDGEGRVRFLVGGSYGPVRTMALDQTGRVLKYAHDAGEVTEIDVCPGAHVFVELVQAVEDRDWRAARGRRPIGRNVGRAAGMAASGARDGR